MRRDPAEHGFPGQVGRTYSADEYIDDLPRKPSGRQRKRRAPRSARAPNPSTPRAQRVAHGPGGVLILLCAAALVMVGWATAALQYTVFSSRDYTTQTAAPRTQAPEPVPTETVTVTALPDSCVQAIGDMSKYLEAAAVIGDAHNLQLDLMSEAYQAIVMKDWKRLNELTDKQRKLGTTLAPASSKVLPVLRDVQKELNQCRSDAG